MIWQLTLLFIALGAVFYWRVSLHQYLLWALPVLLVLSFWCFPWLLWCVFVILCVCVYADKWRIRFISHKIRRLMKAHMPTISPTESEALAAGDVDFETQFFSGDINWQWVEEQLPQLTPKERAFIEGPLKQLCQNIDDWQINQDQDLPESLWQFLKKEGFFSLIIPEDKGGLGFSATAHSVIVAKIASRSFVVAVTVMVPNSLGPAELLLHYGTPAQKDYWLPKLADGSALPCFALTGIDAGSDASAMTDTGVVCYQAYQGENTLGIRLNFNKRYITLAPVADVVGLAFKLQDPESLLDNGQQGITLALIPANHPGVVIGHRHLPVNTPFMNGPIQGKDVFIPLDWIIGGEAYVGKGWQMLMSCLSAGRAISLPSLSVAVAQKMLYSTGAYTRIRRQFNCALHEFEGVQEAMAPIMGLNYLMESVRCVSLAAVDQGKKPSVISAISKYHMTELGRTIINHAMDIHGGKAIVTGPLNYISTAYCSIPISITVEGANILTRNLMIFGQGALRCHPFLYDEVQAINHDDEAQSVVKLDELLRQHIKNSGYNKVRAFVAGVCFSRNLRVFAFSDGEVRQLAQTIQRFSHGFAYVADIALASYGGQLKRKERLSARLGDILSFLYMAMAVLRYYRQQGESSEQTPLVLWSVRYCLLKIQSAFDAIAANSQWSLKLAIKTVVFPFSFGRITAHKDHLEANLVDMMISHTRVRELLTHLVEEIEDNQGLHQLKQAFDLTLQASTAEYRIYQAQRNKQLPTSGDFEQLIELALKQNIIYSNEKSVVLAAYAARRQAIMVDDFTWQPQQDTSAMKSGTETE